jgi:hypothetical protein
MYWPLYMINEQQGRTLGEVWDGQNLMLIFRRSASDRIMNMWWELSSLVEGISLPDEEDQIMWNFTSTGKYAVQSLYAVINHKGVTPVFVNTVWKLKIPPRVQIFLYLVSNNRLLNGDNLAKRRDASDPTCIFCTEKESITHLFFDCCISRNNWDIVLVGLSRL